MLFRLDSLSAFTEYLRARPEAVRGAYCSPQYAKTVTARLRTAGLSYSVVVDESLGGSRFYAEVEINYLNESDLLQHGGLVLALDNITDPRNLGALARSAAFFGVKYILIKGDAKPG